MPIGNGDLSAALDEVGALIVKALPTWCMKGDLADANRKTEALEPDCVVSDVTHPGSATEHETPIAACGPGVALPCWRLELSDKCAEFPTGLRLTIDRGTTTVDPDTHVRAQCVVD